MWQTVVVGIESPWPLVRAVFFIVGLHFSLRGGQEHRDLVVEQFRRFPSDGSYTKESYYEYCMLSVVQRITKAVLLTSTPTRSLVCMPSQAQLDVQF